MDINKARMVDHSEIRKLLNETEDSMILLSEEKEYLKSVVDFIDSKIKENEELLKEDKKVEESIYIQTVQSLRRINIYVS
jgi:uncharacterized protein (DUF2344 family)